MLPLPSQSVVLSVRINGLMYFSAWTSSLGFDRYFWCCDTGVWKTVREGFWYSKRASKTTPYSQLCDAVACAWNSTLSISEVDIGSDVVD